MSSTTWDEAPDPRAELMALIEAGLGRPITNPKTFEGLVQMQTRLHAEQDKLANLLLASEISQDEYIARLDAAMMDAAIIGTDLLGRADFVRIFGEFRVGEVVDIPSFIENHRHAAG